MPTLIKIIYLGLAYTLKGLVHFHHSRNHGDEGQHGTGDGSGGSTSGSAGNRIEGDIGPGLGP